VTGGTGGLGSAVTAALLDRGWRVVVPWVAEKELERVGEHERLHLVRADLFDEASVSRSAAARSAHRVTDASSNRSARTRCSRSCSPTRSS